MAEEKKAKTVTMDTAPKNSEEPKKVPYETLQNAAIQLKRQNDSLMELIEKYKQELQRINNVETRLHFLFEVLNKGSYFDNDFIDKCVDEIKEILTIPESEEEQPEENRED